MLYFLFPVKKPYKNLKASDIVSATIQLTPPDKTIQITELDELTAHLNDLVIYKKDSSYGEYCGQAITITLTMTDGSEEKIMEFNPFVVINGVGYTANYESCEKLSIYANTLLD